MSGHNGILGGAIIFAPIILFLSSIAYATGGGLNNDQTGGMIQVYAMASWVPVVVGLSRIIEPSFPRMAALLILVGALGIVGGVAYGIDSIHMAETGRTAEEMGIAGPLALYVPGVLFPLTDIGIGLMLARSNAELRWQGLALVLAGVLFPVSRIGSVELLAIAVDTLFIIALAPLGWAIVQERSFVRSSA